MKITDYGLWFRYYGSIGSVDGQDKWLKHIDFSSPLCCEMYLNGKRIGFYDGDYSFCFAQLFDLFALRFDINPNSPGFMPTKFLWDFPPNYSPTDSDFLEIE